MYYKDVKNQISTSISKLKKGDEFYLRDIIDNPQAHIGGEFRKDVDNGVFPNVEFVDCEGDADKYRIK